MCIRDSLSLFCLVPSVVMKLAQKLAQNLDSSPNDIKTYIERLSFRSDGVDGGATHDLSFWSSHVTL